MTTAHRVAPDRSRQGESVTVSVARTTMSAALMAPSASDPGTVSARNTVYVPAGNDDHTKWKTSRTAVGASPAGRVNPLLYTGNVVADAKRHRTVKVEDPGVAKASASPCAQPT